MRIKVTDQGVLIPRALLEGVNEVEIRSEHGVLVIVPVDATDPILELGKHPVRSDVTDGAEHHDRYLYGR